jgi:putative ABC transport system permease protein
MLGYYLKLARKSFARTPGLTALMTAAIALGIGICIATITVYHAMSGNPIWWKNDRLYAVTMDSWGEQGPYDDTRPRLPPPQLGYRDATALFAATIPQRKVMMYSQALVVSGGDAHARPRQVGVRVTTADFFPMFDVPFLYGGPWAAPADPAAEPLIVLGKAENDRLFGGRNSVGRTVRVGEREFRITGVLDSWQPLPRFYDLNGGAFTDPEEVFIPFGWTTVLDQYPSGGNTSCRDERPHPTFKDFLAAECIWMQMWVELPDRASRERMQVFMDQYWAEQHRSGRFPRPRNNRLTNVGDWLHEQGVVSNDSRILVGLAFAFLGVCLINTVGLLLARFLNGAAITGVRRALGASRKQIFTQHLVEVGLIAATGAVLGLGLAALALAGVRAMIDALGADSNVLGGYRALARFDTVSVLWALALALVSTLAAGFYPAWRIGRLPPARYLKSQ